MKIPYSIDDKRYNAVILKIIFFTVHFTNENAETITLFEGGPFALNYETSHQLSGVKIYKDGTLIKSAKTFLILNVKPENEGVYYAECHCVRSEYTSLTILRKYVMHICLSQSSKILPHLLVWN